MPTYRYRCGRCDAVHEVFHGMSETRTKCPDCGGRLERLIGMGGGVLLKGGGFYTTEYRSEGYHEAAKKDREAAKPSPKPDAKSPSKSKTPGKGKKAKDG